MRELLLLTVSLIVNYRAHFIPLSIVDSVSIKVLLLYAANFNLIVKNCNHKGIGLLYLLASLTFIRTKGIFCYFTVKYYFGLIILLFCNISGFFNFLVPTELLLGLLCHLVYRFISSGFACIYVSI